MSYSDNYKKTIGANIKVARKIRGLSQRDLAKRMEIAFQNLSCWETGKSAPSLKYLAMLSAILEISMEKLTSENGVAAIAEDTFINSYDYVLIEDNPSQKHSRISLEEEIGRIISQELSTSSVLRQIVEGCEEIKRQLTGRPIW